MDLEQNLTIHEIYASVQGESTYAGIPCAFVRLTYCDLRCTWCDTAHAFYEGKKMTLHEILDALHALEVPLVEITGGEPLLQISVLDLMKELCDRGYKVLLETSGAHDISKVDPRVVRIMDLKCPDSGMSEKNRYENIPHLKMLDEVKFVIASRKDYEWAREQVVTHSLSGKVNAVLFSAVFGKVSPHDVVRWIMDDRLPVRFQLQMHKFIWPPDKKGV